MQSKLNIVDRILSVTSEADFHRLADEVFRHQFEHNESFRHFLRAVNASSSYNPLAPTFLPVEAFKHLHVASGNHEAVFKSSGTSLSQRSSHYVHDLSLYRRLSARHFESLYGPLSEWTVLALLPSYLEAGDSSLVFMVNSFLSAAHPDSCFLLHDLDEVVTRLELFANDQRKVLLIGVSYALLDLGEKCRIHNRNMTVMETGGMKGRRAELTRSELHSRLSASFPASPIHSEYGMTELLSQAYLGKQQRFRPPAWMRAYTVEVSDPLHVIGPLKRGLLAFTDLANVHSCSFIQTRDIGIVYEDGTFTVEGRLDHSDVRGCNLLYT
jgi:hypothetical protein